MPGMRSQATPSYCRHRGSNQAYVRLNAHDHYLGVWGSARSKRNYDRLISEWLANGRRLPQKAKDLSVGELLVAYLDHAKRYYRKASGELTSEYTGIIYAMRPLKKLYIDTPAAEFGPLALRACREHLITSGISRNGCNKSIGRIKRIFRWGVEHELIPSSVAEGLNAVAGLRMGRSEAHETSPVRPVADDFVEQIRDYLPPQIWAMIRLQQLTGARPGEICSLRTGCIDTAGELWEYRPSEHKNTHRGHDRVIPLGPQAQEVLRPFLKADLTAYIFTPSEAEQARSAERRRLRKSPMTPSQSKRRRRRNDFKPYYSTLAYNRAISRACNRAFRPPAELKDKPEELKQWRREHRFAANQLRHASGTKIRRALGLEAAQQHLGHAKADTTQIYAEGNRELAREIARKLG